MSSCLITTNESLKEDFGDSLEMMDLGNENRCIIGKSPKNWKIDRIERERTMLSIVQPSSLNYQHSAG